MMDDGRLSDDQGRVTDFRRTIVIMTSNIASDLREDVRFGFSYGQPDTREKVERIMAEPRFTVRRDGACVLIATHQELAEYAFRLGQWTDSSAGTHDSPETTPAISRPVTGLLQRTRAAPARSSKPIAHFMGSVCRLSRRQQTDASLLQLEALSHRSETSPHRASRKIPGTGASEAQSLRLPKSHRPRTDESDQLVLLV